MQKNKYCTPHLTLGFHAAAEAAEDAPPCLLGKKKSMRNDVKYDKLYAAY